MRCESEFGGSMHDLPVFVAIDRAGDQQISARVHVLQQCSPRSFVERLRRRQDRQLRRAQLVNLILSDHISRAGGRHTPAHAQLAAVPQLEIRHR